VGLARTRNVAHQFCHMRALCRSRSLFPSQIGICFKAPQSAICYLDFSYTSPIVTLLRTTLTGSLFEQLSSMAARIRQTFPPLRMQTTQEGQ